MTGTMRGLVGGVAPDWEARELEIPTPGPGQIRVRVRAAGVNRADLYMLQGSYSPNTKTSNVYTAGFELAGEVDAVDDGIAGVAVGDRVCGATLGAFAQYALLDHRHAIKVPDSVSFTTAAALPVGLATEHDALVTLAGFKPGDSVLVVGATGSIGLTGVQLAKALGACQVIATTTSDEKASHLTEAGADVVVNTKTENLAEKVLKATAGAGVDITLDHVGGELFGELLAATRILGTIVNIGRLAGAETQINLDQLSFRRLRVIGTTFSVRTPEERADVCAALAPQVLPAVADGRIRPVIDQVIPFDEALTAAARLRANESVGKVVLELP